MPDDVRSAEVTDEIGTLLRRVLDRARTERPCATYRVQLHAGFGFRTAIAILPYLARLGITDVYTSPFLRSVSGSTHGYDVVDHAHLDPEIGSDEDFEAFRRALDAHGMGLLVDVVPNHVGIGKENARWLDVLENGPSSICARFFDVDWAPLKTELAGKILLPILGDHYGAVLERGELRLEFDAGAFWLRYWDERLPISPRSVPLILRHDLASLDPAPPQADVQELLSILTAVEHLPPRGTTAPGKVVERHREKEVIKRRLAALYDASTAIRAHVDRAIESINGVPGDAASFDLLDALLDDQGYRLAYWRVAGEEINYRRFFDINALAAIRQEDPVVFGETHALLLRLVGEGKIQGFRIDHPDGLYDPSEYLRMLQEEVVAGAARAFVVEESGEERWRAIEIPLRKAYREAIERAPRDVTWRPLYVVVEKILSRKERIPDDWAIDGTVGYEFLNLLNGLFVSRENEARLDEIYGKAIGGKVDFATLVRRNKRLIMKTSMVSEINVLAHRLSALAERSRRTRDFTLNSLRHALIEMVACFPVYRTYIRDGAVDARDLTYVEQAHREALRYADEATAPALDFIRAILSMEPILGAGADVRRDHLAFVMKLQQVTGSVMAKGVEDTTFYGYNRLVSLNEVGGEPEHFGGSIETFHRQNAARAKHFPRSLLASSTHDTKRSEDARTRVDVLSELPDAWSRFLAVARDANESRRVYVASIDRWAPDGSEEHLLYQSLLALAPHWPLGEGDDDLRTRIEEYMLKAIREAKVNDSWTQQRLDYEEALTKFVRAVMKAPARDHFNEAFALLLGRVKKLGALASLAQTVLKIAAPGVPDVYQGTESWSFALVDPDNRRPVEFDAHAALLAEIDDALQTPARRDVLLAELAGKPHDRRAKLFVSACALRARRDHRALFTEGDYVPVDVVGKGGPHVVSFARVHGGSLAIVLAPRLVASVVGDRGAWSDTFLVVPDELEARLGDRPLVDVFSGVSVTPVRREACAAIPVAPVFDRFPVGLLTLG